MNSRQIEELAKLFMDVGKLTMASLVFGVLQITSNPTAVLIITFLGLTFSFGFFIMGLKLFKEVL